MTRSAWNWDAGSPAVCVKHPNWSKWGELTWRGGRVKIPIALRSFAVTWNGNASSNNHWKAFANFCAPRRMRPSVSAKIRLLRAFCRQEKFGKSRGRFGIMQRHQLEHIIRAAAGVTGAEELVIIGSQAVLGQFP